VPPDFDRYTAASRKIMEIFQRYTPLVEPLSLDEAFLDVAGCERLHGDAVQIGRAIKNDILRETRLVASIGVAPSKFLAKLASDLDKPDGFRVIRRDEIRTVLDPLPVSKIFGVGPRTAKRLEALGVHTVVQLASLGRDEVTRRFGASGAWIHDLAHGVDPRRVTPNRPEKSHGMERTFEDDVSDTDELRLFLREFCEEVAFDLRHRGLRGRTITLKARYWNFKTVTRSKTLDVPTNLGTRIYAVGRELLERIAPGPLRLLGVSVSGLDDVRKPIQPTLFDEGDPFLEKPAAARADGRDDARRERTQQALDKLRDRFGKGTVIPASLLGRNPLRGADGSDGKPDRPQASGL
jgi:DNA polymerase-4